ncbi:MAG: hypothetical protein AAGF90_17105 [Pseudomonadota bacterium]
MLTAPAACATGDRSGGGVFGAPATPPTVAEKRLKDDNRVFNETVAGGVAVGMARGLLYGALIGFTSGDLDKALAAAGIGAAIGGVAGGIDGWRVAVRQEAARRQVREIELVTLEVERENRRIEQSIANVDLVIADTQRSLRGARVAFANDQATENEVRAREARARRNLDEIDELIENLADRNRDYQQVANELRSEGQDTTAVDRELAETRALLAQKRRERDLLEQELVRGRIG